jgi:2-polyprenyl-3-methyl-5-hydroxy-6-metoxy-1,4-benzoquinol methylase
MSEFTRPQETWNQRFQNASYIFSASPNTYLCQQAADLLPGKALAVADGEGRNGVWLAEQGLAVDAFDFSEVAIKKAKALAQKRKGSVNFVCTNWQAMMYDAALGCDFVDLRTYETVLSEGSARSGGSALLGMTAREPL